MADKNVYAVPVFDKTTNSFKGFLSFNDIVHNIVHFFVAKAKLAHPDLAHDTHQLLTKSSFHQTDADNIQRKVFNHPLGDLVSTHSDLTEKAAFAVETHALLFLLYRHLWR